LKRHLLGCLRRASLFSCILACAFTTASSAYSATFSYSSAVTTAANTYLGGPGFYLPYTANNNTATVPSSLTLINLGGFMTAPAAAAPNGNVVTSAFTLNITTGLPGVTSPVSFTGSVVPDTVHTGEYDFAFSPSKTYFWSGDPNGPATFDVQNVGTCAPSLVGCYTVGVEPILINGAGKTTTLWAFIGPANLTTPEPMSAATTGLASIALLMFAIRRKLQPQRS
jgi:hypothetical protein